VVRSTEPDRVSERRWRRTGARVGRPHRLLLDTFGTSGARSTSPPIRWERSGQAHVRNGQLNTDWFHLGRADEPDRGRVGVGVRDPLQQPELSTDGGCGASTSRATSASSEARWSRPARDAVPAGLEAGRSGFDGESGDQPRLRPFVGGRVHYAATGDDYQEAKPGLDLSYAPPASGWSGRSHGLRRDRGRHPNRSTCHASRCCSRRSAFFSRTRACSTSRPPAQDAAASARR
jgi:hypothetical protein